MFLLLLLLILPAVPANAPVSDPVLVTEPVSPVPVDPVTATNIFSEPPSVTRTQDVLSASSPAASGLSLPC